MVYNNRIIGCFSVVSSTASVLFVDFNNLNCSFILLMTVMFRCVLSNMLL
jgi:hypothetical protein